MTTPGGRFPNTSRAERDGAGEISPTVVSPTGVGAPLIVPWTSLKAAKYLVSMQPFIILLKT